MKASVLHQLCGLYSVCLFWLQTRPREKQDKITENTKPCMKSWITPTSFWCIFLVIKMYNVTVNSTRDKWVWAAERQCHLLGRNHVGCCFGGKSIAVLGASKSEIVLFTILDGRIRNFTFIVINLASHFLVLPHLTIYNNWDNNWLPSFPKEVIWISRMCSTCLNNYDQLLHAEGDS